MTGTALMDPLAEIKRLYNAATRATITRDFDRAIDLLKSMSTEEERERATVYMAGIAAMRSEWQGGAEMRRAQAKSMKARRPRR